MKKASFDKIEQIYGPLVFASIIFVLVVLLGIIALPSSERQRYKPVNESSEDGSYVSLFKCVAAGDYHYVLVRSSGIVTYMRFSRDYRISRYGKGLVDPKKFKDLLAFFKNGSFHRLDDEYQLSPAQPGLPPIKYEDTFYFITRADLGQRKSIFSHEHALPQEAYVAVEKLEAVATGVPSLDIAEPVLLALPGKMFNCLREKANMPSIRMDSGNMSLHPRISAAVKHLGCLTYMDKAKAEEVKGKLFSGHVLVRILIDDEEFAMLLLEKDDR